MNKRLRGITALLTALALFMAAGAVQAEVYKVVDEHGNVTYTDQAPGPDAKPMVLRGLSIIAPQKTAPPPTDPAAAEAEVAGDDQQEVMSMREVRRNYRDFRIVSPEHEQTISGTGNAVTIAWDTQYRLQPGMTVTIYLDGVAQAPTTQSAMTTERLDRGAHEVRAELVDSSGRRVAATETITFFIQQWSANFDAQQQSQGN